MKIIIEQVENGIIYEFDKMKKVFNSNEHINDNTNELETMGYVFREMLQDFGVFNSKHNSHRLNIEVVKQ